MSGSSIKAMRSLLKLVAEVSEESPLPDNYGLWIYVGPEDTLPTAHMKLGDLRRLVEEWS